jgi:hypothetical protein
LQELNNKINNDEHVIVTAPDRFFQDSIVLLLVDWPADLIDQALTSIKGSQVRIAIHIFDYNDSDYTWLIDVANQADIIAINLNSINHIDLIKGYLISKSKSYYFGRLGINKIFPNFTNDPIGELLVKIGQKISQMEEK